MWALVSGGGDMEFKGEADALVSGIVWLTFGIDIQNMPDSSRSGMA